MLLFLLAGLASASRQLKRGGRGGGGGGSWGGSWGGSRRGYRSRGSGGGSILITGNPLIYFLILVALCICAYVIYRCIKKAKKQRLELEELRKEVREKKELGTWDVRHYGNAPAPSQPRVSIREKEKWDIEIEIEEQIRKERD